MAKWTKETVVFEVDEESSIEVTRYNDGSVTIWVNQEDGHAFLNSVKLKEFIELLQAQL